MGVSRVVRVGSPYNGVDLAEVDFEQQTDTMYLAHLDYPLTKLTRAAHDSWAFSSVTLGPPLAAPTGLIATPHVNNTDSANGGDAYYPRAAHYTVTALDANGLESRASATVQAVNDLDLKRNYNEFFWTALPGAERYNVYKADNSQFLGYIGTTAANSFTDDNIGPDLTRAPPEAYNPFAAAGDYPSTVAFFEQRLFLGRTRNSPNAIWGSRSTEFENFDQSTPLKADDSIVLAANAGRVNAINQLVATTSLLALTSDSLFRVDSGADGGYLTASPPATIRRQIGRGSSRLSPLVVDNVVFYTPAVGSGVRSLNYKFEIDGLASDDVTIFSPHMFSGMQIVSWCYAQEPRSIIWAVRSDGKLLAFTWEQAQQVWGWTICETDGEVLSCCAIAENGEDRVYLVVRRTIGGEERTFIERMAASRWDSVEDCCFLDCAVSFSYEEPRSLFRNLWHLEGREVWGLVDGFVVKGLTVTNGIVELPASTGGVKKATFGLPFTVDIQTMPVSMNTDKGSSAARKQQPGEIVLHIRESRGVLAGAGREDGTIPKQLFEIKARGDEAWGAPDKLKDGRYLMDAPNVVSGQTSAYIRQTDPLPLTLVGVYLDPIIES
ncbi:hypothetical protein ASE85_02480 [Sphingobium sp. Leaf26]|uniref:hypothetical protein n=1 Tax=Sphingobium sp. Leaf26 TaxID=1735693 RepID=UPI0006F3A341|nr:hypothetical protein [Sphingobium sp. Leaf26]KQN09820.1 hypothetical protein ASE85_02480 [Sphingobium sp. Leaf26]